MSLIKIDAHTYKLERDADYVWIKVGPLAVEVKRADEGVVVDVWPNDPDESNACAHSLGTCAVPFDEADVITSEA